MTLRDFLFKSMYPKRSEKAVPFVARRAKEGHSLAMLTRIAAAVEKRVEIRFVPKKRRLQRA
jgi:hypothetical protein